MLAATSGNRWCAVAVLMFFGRSWDASTAVSTGSSVTSSSTRSSTSPWGRFSCRERFNRAQSSMEHETSDKVQAHRRYSGRKPECHCKSCRGNRPCTSYSRTNGYDKLRTNGYDIAYTFTHNNITLEHNAMNNKNTIAHMDVHNTQY